MEQINLFQGDMKWKVWTEKVTVPDPGHHNETCRTSIETDLLTFIDDVTAAA